MVLKFHRYYPRHGIKLHANFVFPFFSPQINFRRHHFVWPLYAAAGASSFPLQEFLQLELTSSQYSMRKLQLAEVAYMHISHSAVFPITSTLSLCVLSAPIAGLGSGRSAGLKHLTSF